MRASVWSSAVRLRTRRPATRRRQGAMRQRAVEVAAAGQAARSSREAEVARGQAARASWEAVATPEQVVRPRGQRARAGRRAAGRDRTAVLAGEPREPELEPAAPAVRAVAVP